MHKLFVQNSVTYIRLRYSRITKIAFHKFVLQGYTCTGYLFPFIKLVNTILQGFLTNGASGSFQGGVVTLNTLPHQLIRYSIDQSSILIVKYICINK